MADRQTEPTEAGEPRYVLRSRAVTASSHTRQYESYEADLAVEGRTAER